MISEEELNEIESIKSIMELYEVELKYAKKISSKNEFIVMFDKFVEISIPYRELEKRSMAFCLENMLDFVDSPAGKREIDETSFWSSLYMVVTAGVLRDEGI
jgi:hypothetical protein